MKIVSSDQMRHIEQVAFEKGLNSEVLMRNAGNAISEEVDFHCVSEKYTHILSLIGPGNNGMDGLVTCSELLKKDSYNITIILLTDTFSDNEVFLKGLGLIRSDVKIFDISDMADNLKEVESELLTVNVLIDAIFGIGLSRKIKNPLKSYINKIQNFLNEDVFRIAVDVPTGVDSDKGEIDSDVLKVDLTLALGYAKLAHFTQPAASFCGEVKVLDIGIPDQKFKGIDLDLITEEFVSSKIPTRELESNKGSFGKVMIVGGSDEFIGASALAGIAASRTGAGLITSAIPRSIVPSFTYLFPESTLIQLPETQNREDGWVSAKLIYKELNEYSVMLIGCGLGLSRKTISLVENILISRINLPNLVIDADALNILSKMSNWWNEFSDNAVLTPHPGEMARLTGLTISDVQSNRLEVVKEFSHKWNKTVVLKGANTIISTPDRKAWVSEFANPALASAGTGDVLSGIIAGLLAQKLSIRDSAILGVYIHGCTGKIFKSKSGLMARDLLKSIPIVMEGLRKYEDF